MTSDFYSRLLALLPALAGLGVIVALLAVVIFMRLQARRRRALRALYRGADALEHDLKECRARLERAHASMNVAPGVPAAGEADARTAVDAALRELLEHRLWLRDQADEANQHELDAAVAALDKARATLSEQLAALDSAQRALETAVRERIEDLSQR
ncbi:MAG TPA: hypothetical protein VJ727_10725 [Rhodanobacteraceae bacterium]|nr:hypothetical protein [Rhodanobacteraceae bacterium]